MDLTPVKEIIEMQSGTVAVAYESLSNPIDSFYMNTELQMRSASIIKLFILAACADQFSSGNLSPETLYHVRETDLVDFSLVTDLSQTTWRLDDLATLMIVLSDNTATNILIDMLGFDLINDFIQRGQYSKTRLERKMMDTAAQARGLDNYISVQDVVSLLKDIYAKKIVSEYWSEWMLNVLSKQKDRTMLGRYLPESIQIANKTGLNNGTQHDIGFIYAHGNVYLTGVFVDGEPDEIKGFECIGQIANYLINNIHKNGV